MLYELLDKAHIQTIQQNSLKMKSELGMHCHKANKQETDSNNIVGINQQIYFGTTLCLFFSLECVYIIPTSFIS